MQWCSGYGMLVLLLGFVYLGLVYFHIVKPLLRKPFKSNVVKPLSRTLGNFFSNL